MKIAVTTSSFGKFDDEPLRLLRERGFEPVLNPHGRALTEDEAVDLLQGCTGVAAGTEPLTARVMDAVPGLRVISRCGVGMDNVDQDAAAARGILVRSTPGAPTRAVVELTLGYALGLMRQIPRMDREMRAGTWQKRMGNLLYEKRVGVVGFGRIGRAVADAFAAMGCPVRFFDPAVLEDVPPYSRCERDELFAWADIVTLHSSRPASGGALVGAAEIALMRRGSWVINAARGGLVDEEALAQALRSGALAGAALDVFEQEPYKGPLLEAPGAILTPHIGSYAVEARIAMELETVRNLLEALDSAGAGFVQGGR